MDTMSTPHFTYVEITQAELDRGYPFPVHVKGWNLSFRFTYIETESNGTHIIRSAKSGLMRTKNPLLHTQRNTPSTKRK
jgi:hypothetical protein